MLVIPLADSSGAPRPSRRRRRSQRRTARARSSPRGRRRCRRRWCPRCRASSPRRSARESASARRRSVLPGVGLGRLEAGAVPGVAEARRCRARWHTRARRRARARRCCADRRRRVGVAVGAVADQQGRVAAIVDEPLAAHDRHRHEAPSWLGTITSETSSSGVPGGRAPLRGAYRQPCPSRRGKDARRLGPAASCLARRRRPRVPGLRPGSRARHRPAPLGAPVGRRVGAAHACCRSLAALRL